MSPPTFGEDHIVLLNGVLDNVGHSQHLLLILLSVHFNLTDLSSVGSPFYLRIVYLQEMELVGYPKVYSLFSYPGFQLHYPG